MTKEEYELLPCVQVLRLFEEEFTKELVDSDIPEYKEDIIIPDDSSIIIKFPKVTVSNELDQSTDIYDLFVKVIVSKNGSLLQSTDAVTMVRSTFTYAQYISDYAHSHLNGISPFFKTPCFGSGPIVNTMKTLKDKNFDLRFWGLFIYELKKYVTVESLMGVPYRKMDSINDLSTGDLYPIRKIKDIFIPRAINVRLDFYFLIINQFIKHLLSLKILKFSFYGNTFLIKEPIPEVNIKISNALIKYINSRTDILPHAKRELFTKLFMQCIIKNGLLYDIRKGGGIPAKEGSLILNFKGNPVYLKIIDTDKKINNYYNVLEPYLLSYILKYIIILLNTHYGKSEEDLQSANVAYLL